MNKPTLEKFGLTEFEYKLEEKKGGKITSFIMYLLLSVFIICNIYYLFFYDSTFFLSKIPELLVMDFIGGSILMTWFFIIHMFFSFLISFLFPNLNLLRHSQKYIEYKKALTAFEKEKHEQELAKKFIDNVYTSKLNKIDKQVLESEKILSIYGKIIADSQKHGISALKKSNLPCSIAKIKQSYFIYIDALIKWNRKLPKDFSYSLVSTYEKLNAFISDEEADEINEIAIMLIKKDRSIFTNPDFDKKIDKYFNYVEKVMHDEILYDEINEYIAECCKKFK